MFGPVVAVVLSSTFGVSGMDGSGQSGQSGAAVVDVLLSTWSVFTVSVGQGLLLVLACSASKIMIVMCPPPRSVGRVSERMLAEPSKDWTVARTPLISRLLNICCTSSGHLAGKCSLPESEGEGSDSKPQLQKNDLISERVAALLPYQ